jgi:RNA-directed DNA polymerase
MDWLQYSERIIRLATVYGYSDEEINGFLKYSKNLFDHKLPIIFDQNHLSLLVGYKYELLLKITNSTDKFYRSFTIPKKRGGTRLISEPLPSLKEIQRWILDNILYRCKASGYAKAYKKNRSIKNNAIFHVNKEMVLTLDIKDFFPSITFEKVLGFYLQTGYSKQVSMMLAKLCCLDGSLPQGAPTSPALSNLIMFNVDKRISSYSKKHNINYTRYADDLSFSGVFNPGTIISFVKRVLIDNNLFLNEEKTHLRKKNQSQEITGVVVNKKMQVSRKTRKKLRQSIYYIKHFGLASHLEKTSNTKANSIRHLLGVANFILFINPQDKEANCYKKYLINWIKTDEE